VDRGKDARSLVCTESKVHQPTRSGRLRKRTTTLSQCGGRRESPSSQPSRAQCRQDRASSGFVNGSSTASMWRALIFHFRSASDSTRVIEIAWYWHPSVPGEMRVTGGSRRGAVGRQAYARFIARRHQPLSRRGGGKWVRWSTLRGEASVYRGPVSRSVTYAREGAGVVRRNGSWSIAWPQSRALRVGTGRKPVVTCSICPQCTAITLPNSG